MTHTAPLRTRAEQIRDELAGRVSQLPEPTADPDEITPEFIAATHRAVEKLVPEKKGMTLGH